MAMRKRRRNRLAAKLSAYLETRGGFFGETLGPKGWLRPRVVQQLSDLLRDARGIDAVVNTDPEGAGTTISIFATEDDPRPANVVIMLERPMLTLSGLAPSTS